MIKGESKRESQRKERVRKRGVPNWEQSSHCSVLYTQKHTQREREKERKRGEISPYTRTFLGCLAGCMERSGLQNETRMCCDGSPD